MWGLGQAPRYPALFLCLGAPLSCLLQSAVGRREDGQRSGKAWPLTRRDQEEDRYGASLLQRGGSHFGSTPLGDGLLIPAACSCGCVLPPPPYTASSSIPGLFSWHPVLMSLAVSSGPGQLVAVGGSIRMGGGWPPYGHLLSGGIRCGMLESARGTQIPDLNQSIEDPGEMGRACLSTK